MTNIFEALREDHERQRSLIKTVLLTEGDEKDRREAFQEIITELDAHAKAEERSLYAAMLAHKASQPTASHSVHEHTEIDELVEKVKELEFSSPHWIRAFKELAKKVHHHLAEEEHGVFQLAGKVLTEKEKTELVAKFEKHKAVES